MKTIPLKQRILFSFFIIIFVMGFFIALFRIYVIKINIIERAQQEAKNNLKAARSVYDNELERIKLAFDLSGRLDKLNEFKEKIGLDYIYIVPIEKKSSAASPIVRMAFNGKASGGTRIIDKEELLRMGREYSSRAEIEIRDTLRSKPTDLKVLDQAMAIEYAMPLYSQSQEIIGVIYAGKIINRDFELVDRIHDLVFENRLYDQKPVGTVTIFQNDVRIATNVLDKKGQRAIGTRVSARVYDAVLKEGKTWVDRAFVVTDWYLTAYEPIRDINGAIIGILYVGILEKPFRDMTRNVLLGFLAIIVSVVALAAGLAYVLAWTITKPLAHMLEATTRMADGNLECKVATQTSIQELNILAHSFNTMAAALHARDKSLNISNEKLAALNKTYLDLIAFVAHELKGILSSTILNAYSVRDGFLGLINFKQRKALDSVTKNLDYFASTIRNFLNLSRIEKGELVVHKQDIRLKEDIFDSAIDAFLKEAEEKSIKVENNIAQDLTVQADLDLLQIVANNLVANAIKYGVRGGMVRITAQDKAGFVAVEVYNDAAAIKEEDKDKLFKKFARLNYTETRKEKGTGLGLFVTKEIIERHDGSIRVEPREGGNAFIFEIPN